eukprot:TRINITY_DN10345_c0_g1_i3.p1 TRINITY_DN10345_c0_g1~~TRINITY_DN10345_c0_g1_i3.p1  ORF type:complete len:263 (+),score=44.41 TRINITY_DN10345_c0_g1_i3:84-791(+)
MASVAIFPKYPFPNDRFRTNPYVTSSRSFHNCLFVNGNTRSLKSFSVHDSQEGLSRRFLSHERDLNSLSWCTSAVGSGLESSITDPKEYDIQLKNVSVVVESRDDDKLHVRVDVMGEETQKAFDIVLTNLARTAPPIPGFRRTKGGKTSNVPKSFLLQILGRDRVTKFVIQEIVSSTMADYVQKENLKVKNKFNTTQTAEELKSAFAPGSEFGFNATVEFEESETEETISPSSKV